MSVPPGKFYRRDLYEPIMRWMGTWSGVIDYVPGDVVTNASTIYICIVANSNVSPPNTTYWTPTGSNTQKYTTLIDVVNTTTETDILQAAGYAIPGNTLGSNGLARVQITGDFLQNTGGAVTMTLAVYFGGTKIADGVGNYGAISVRQPFTFELWIQNRGVTNSQWIAGHMKFNQIGVSGTVGEGDPMRTGSPSIWGSTFAQASDPAKDTTTSQTVRVTFKWGTASANASFRAYHSLIEFI